MKTTDTIQNPWAGLSSYEDPAKSARRLKFCGRDEATYDVAQLIDDNFLVTKTSSPMPWSMPSAR